MKIVLQKVSQASVTVNNEIISKINKGYMLLVGISTEDTLDDVNKLSNKVLSLRIFENPEDSEDFWKLNIKQIEHGQILSVSQFTLLARTKKGTKPDFHMAAKGHVAIELYNHFLNNLRKELGEGNVKDGQFGAMMSCGLTNEGPVTILLDSKN
ncbi:D-tyrosyl-tRNA(Tyr) deacylase [Monosporozyma unispora]|nr:D-tyrosyl-tRNA(Tyr) deacylase [Kazachstania unispora]